MESGCSEPIRPPLHLAANHPNPFTDQTQIVFAGPTGVSATPAIYDATGRLVRTLLSGQQTGKQMVSWNGTNDAGDPVEAGAYFYKLTVGKESKSRRMLLLK